MKRAWTIFAASLMLAGTAVAAEPAACSQKVTEKCPQKVTECSVTASKNDGKSAKECPMRSSNRNLFNISRGLTNIVTCPLEIPRCMLLRNGDVPIWGFISGAVEGTGCTVMRAFSGVTDILFLGFDKGRVFSPTFREFVWQSQWEPK